MPKAKVHSKDKKRIYLHVDHKHLSKHAHIFKGKGKHIVPVKAHTSHKNLKKGDEVHFQILPNNNQLYVFLYYSTPLLTLLLGFFVGRVLGVDLQGMFLFCVLFLLVGFTLKSIISKQHAFHSTIQVDIKSVRKR
jgi:positive regulator of sigma E activity